MTIDDLKALEERATPMGENGWGVFQHFPEFSWHLGADRNKYAKGQPRIADVGTREDACLLAVLRCLAPEIMALVEAANMIRAAQGQYIDTDGHPGGYKLLAALDAFNAKLGSL